MALSDLSRTELLDLLRDHDPEEAKRGYGKEDLIRILEDEHGES